MDLSDQRLASLTHLWQKVLSEIPPANLNDLLSEHFLIRETLGVKEDGPLFDLHAFLGHSDRESSIGDLVAWLRGLGVDDSAVEIRSSQHGFGLFAKKDLAVDQVPVQIPQKATLSVDYGDEKTEIKRLQESDPMLQNMSNVALSMILAYTVLSNDKKFSAYIKALPASYNIPLFFTKAEILSLKPSPVFESTLLMFRALARHYVYFVLKIANDAILKNKKNKNTYNYFKSPFNSEKFTFDFYRWCVATVATRMNSVPSLTFQKENGEPVVIPSLIPLLDFCNYHSAEENAASMVFDGNSQSVQLTITKPVKSGDQIYLHYGNRPNSEFLLHNGFVPHTYNPNDRYQLKLGLPKSTDSSAKQEILKQLGLNLEKGGYQFYLSHEEISLDQDPLWNFVLVFVADDINNLDKTETKQKAQKFLVQRLNLLQSQYKNLVKPSKGASVGEQFIFTLHSTEVELLKRHEQKFSQLKLN